MKSITRIFILFIIVFICSNSVKIIAQDQISDKGNPFSQSKYVPDISLILDFSYNIKNKNNNFLRSSQFPGFSNHSLKDINENSHKNFLDDLTEEGFNFNYGELVISSIVDPYFNLQGVFTLEDEKFSIEEAFFTTRSLPLGLQIKAGKFLSSFGRINEQHSHYWDFIDLPVMLYSVFGAKGLNEKGVQINWIAPLDYLLLFGCEVLSGDNKLSFGRNEVINSRGDIIIDEARGPNLYNFFVKNSCDFDELTILAGLSIAFGKTRFNNNLDYSEDDYSFLSDTYLLNGNLTLKYLLDANTYISLQSEYIYRNMDGRLISNTTREIDEIHSNKKQGGFYSQLVSKFALRWRAGLRYDLINKNEINRNNLNTCFPENLSRISFMMEFNPTEFSRIRMQLNYNNSRFSINNMRFNKESYYEFILQCNLAIGSHGAHSF